MNKVKKDGVEYILITPWNIGQALREIDEEIEKQKKGEER